MNSLQKQCHDLFVKDTRSKVKFTLISAAIFLLISSPLMYNIVESLLGRLVTVSVKGCPTTLGLLLHTVVFALISYGIMNLNL